VFHLSLWRTWSFVSGISQPPVTTELSWMLCFLHNRIGRTFADTAAGTYG